jgi:hypothetical protein
VLGGFNNIITTILVTTLKHLHYSLTLYLSTLIPLKTHLPYKTTTIITINIMSSPSPSNESTQPFSETSFNILNINESINDNNIKFKDYPYNQPDLQL